MTIYIVTSATGIDKKFETYEEACACVQSMRRDGIESAIVTSDDPWKCWDVWKTGMTRKYVVNARSSDEARGITNDPELDTLQCH